MLDTRFIECPFFVVLIDVTQRLVIQSLYHFQVGFMSLRWSFMLFVLAVSINISPPTKSGLQKHVNSARSEMFIELYLSF